MQAPYVSQFRAVRRYVQVSQPLTNDLPAIAQQLGHIVRVCVCCMHSIINMLFSAEGGAVPLFDCLSMPCNVVDHWWKEQ